MLFERDCGEQRSLETMRSASAHDAAKSTHRVARWFSIVWEIVQPSLNGKRSTELIDYSPLRRCESKRWWDDSRSIEHPTNMANKKKRLAVSSFFLSPYPDWRELLQVARLHEVLRGPCPG